MRLTSALTSGRSRSTAAPVWRSAFYATSRQIGPLQLFDRVHQDFDGGKYRTPVIFRPHDAHRGNHVAQRSRRFGCIGSVGPHCVINTCAHEPAGWINTKETLTSAVPHGKMFRQPLVEDHGRDATLKLLQCHVKEMTHRCMRTWLSRAQGQELTAQRVWTRLVDNPVL